MKEDVIELSSDDEDSCNESFERKPVIVNKTDAKEVSGPRQFATNGSFKVKVEETLVPQYDFTNSTFLSNPPPNKVPENVHGKAITRQFWKAGDYELQASSNKSLPDGMDHVRVHPKFLHSNATSHKWALGAIAELLDNAIDEVANGATFVSVDKVTNALDNTPALLIHDDGGGMDPENMRHCMSLGYSRKASNMTIGQYGNGFKTSTMRLGADVIVFSRCVHKRCITQSAGLLSYTFLRATGHEDIIVPMVDFEIVNGRPKKLLRTTEEDWTRNFSIILQWSPYLTEAELLSQFNDLGQHGTKLIVYNLWMNDDGELELDFDTDEQDIQIRGAPKIEKSDGLQKQLTNGHVANRLRYSLRAYASILYLQMPPNFQIILRGKVVEHLSIADDLKFTERILYKPNTKDFNFKEVSVITTIGFAKEAPLVSVHGFNVYHKNRLIMPFWKVFQENSSRGRGVVGVLEANFMEPAHDKQDFERTPILQRLETRLKQMTVEYWNLHCNLIGYQAPKQSNKNRSSASQNESAPSTVTNIESRQGESSAPSTPPQPGADEHNAVDSLTAGKRSTDKMHTGESASSKRVKVSSSELHGYERAIIRNDQGALNGLDDAEVNVGEILLELSQLRERCERYRSNEEALKLKQVAELESELAKVRAQCKALSRGSAELIKPKEECK
ncbi:hypothetical protein KP509_10G031800 [Ceratopteris richardii]|uniref:Morc S5 domain-containing protein n=1 Tax=Ceratopteris richardii TaxID=49495 RepID=A0A8T2U0F8_CERRI|nr:hypothetical protein KP509_10G031800 [Ceratopteris richardii]